MKKPIKNPDLVNAIERHREYPNTFEIPLQEDINAIKPGDFAKICTGDERFWVMITQLKEDGKIVGKIDNHLLFTDNHNLSFGDYVSFYPENIFAILNKKSEEN